MRGLLPPLRFAFAALPPEFERDDRVLCGALPRIVVSLLILVPPASRFLPPPLRVRNSGISGAGRMTSGCSR